MMKLAPSQARIGGYVLGFTASVGLTLLAYFAATTQLAPTWETYGLIVGLALVQLVTQLVFFLHVGRESKPRWNLMVFLFMLLVVFILVAGSLWIMANLNYNMNLTPSDQSNYLQQEEGIHH